MPSIRYGVAMAKHLPSYAVHGMIAVTVSRGLTHSELIADNQMPRSSCLLTEYKLQTAATVYKSIPTRVLLLQLINGYLCALATVSMLVATVACTCYRPCWSNAE